MTPKAEKLLPKIEKAGVKASLKAGHPLSQEELLNVRVQLLPTIYRWGLGGISSACAYGSYTSAMATETGESLTASIALAIVSLLFFIFALAGVRKTLGTILENMPVDAGGELLSAAVEGIGSIIGGLFDGV